MTGQVWWRRRNMGPLFAIVLLWIGLLGQVLCSSGVGSSDEHGGAGELGTIAFASVGRGHYAYDLFSIKAGDSNSWVQNGAVTHARFRETKLTDGVSVNYNGQFVGTAEKNIVLDRLKRDGICGSNDSSLLIFVSERGGSSRVFFRVFSEDDGRKDFEAEALKVQVDGQDRRHIDEKQLSRNHGLTIASTLPFDGPVMYDRPFVSRGSILFVSTAEPRSGFRQSWVALYSTNLLTGTTVRLTPRNVADFSPSVSPSGEWVVVASYGKHQYHGELDELVTNLYVVRAEDGSSRRLLVKHGGWPSWADDRTIFFHRRADDGWWSVFRIVLPESFLEGGEGSLREERITPPGVHAFTPAASRTGDWIAVATRRPTSAFRHVEVFDLASRVFVKLTEKISPAFHHYNPFVSESGSVGYHRCRGNPSGSSVVPRLQHARSPLPGLALLRVDGTFPSFSPDGSLLGVIWNTEDSTVGITEEEEGLYIMNADGTNERRVFSGKAFGIAWNPVRKGVLYTSAGPEFRSLHTVSIMSVHNVDGEGPPILKQLTEAGNDAFPSPSPDGRYLVFRSKRSGYKNLYIMDAAEGEKKFIRRLTNGPWTDQHPVWSPTGEWIAFTSNRENPNVGIFGKCAIYLIRPNGTGLRKIIESGDGMAVHPNFSPDGKRLVFVSDLAGVSSEPISEASAFQPCGEIFTADVDGSNMQRLTHNGVEDGTASWSPRFLSASDLSNEGPTLRCDFGDGKNLFGQKSLHNHYSSQAGLAAHCAGVHSSSVYSE